MEQHSAEANGLWKSWSVFRPTSRLFLYINFSAIHYPNAHYVPGKVKDDKESHAAALRYVDSCLPALFQALERTVQTLWSLPCLTTARVMARMVMNTIASLTKLSIQSLTNILS